MTDLKMIERIKALLAKAASTEHPAEAEAFFAKAYELMRAHQIDSGDLDRTDPVFHEHVARRKGRAAPDWDFRLMFSVAEYFGCECIQVPDYGTSSRGRYEWIGHYMDLIGRESARVTAIEMHKYLVATVRKLGREKAKANPVKNADWWARKIGVALHARIQQLAPKPEKAKTEAGRNALVTVDQVTAMVKKLHPDAEPIKGQTWTTESAIGIAEGIGLNVQVNKGGTLALR